MTCCADTCVVCEVDGAPLDPVLFAERQAAQGVLHYGRCQVCRGLYRLTRDGKVRAHQSWRRHERCYGSGETPGEVLS